MRKIRNEASSRPGIFSRTLRFYYVTIHPSCVVVLMMIASITFNSSLVPLIEGLCSLNPWEFEFSVFRWNQTDDLGITVTVHRSDQLSHACM